MRAKTARANLLNVYSSRSNSKHIMNATNDYVKVFVLQLGVWNSIFLLSWNLSANTGRALKGVRIEFFTTFETLIVANKSWNKKNRLTGVEVNLAQI